MTNKIKKAQRITKYARAIIDSLQYLFDKLDQIEQPKVKENNDAQNL